MVAIGKRIRCACGNIFVASDKPQPPTIHRPEAPELEHDSGATAVEPEADTAASAPEHTEP